MASRPFNLYSRMDLVYSAERRTLKSLGDRMKSFILAIFLTVFSAFLFSGCGPSEEENALYRKVSRYRQNFTTSSALLIRERNGFPLILASAFLIDKQRGLFVSAKHFVGNESAGNCRIFFNGAVYNGFLLAVPAITDLAVIKIADIFAVENFPEPRRWAESIQRGDKIFVEGIHPHPQSFQAGREIVPIFSEFYGLTGKGEEFVFERLAGEVVELSREIANKNIKDTNEILSGVSSRFIMVRTMQDHRFSFSGLSGGPTVNERDEIIGINSVEDQAFLEISKGEAIYHPWVSLNLVPISELEKLRPLLSQVR